MVSPRASSEPADALGRPLQYLRGVGPARAEQLRRLDLETIEDLLWHVPRRHDDRSRLTPIRDAAHGVTETVSGAILSVGEMRPRRGLVVTKAAIADDSGIAYVVWFNQPYLKRQLTRGARMIVTGKVERRFGEIQISAPEFEVLGGDDEDTLHTGRIVPVYPLTEGLSPGMMRVLVRNALEAALPAVADPLPDEVRVRQGLLTLPEAMRLVHFPDTLAQAGAARRRLAFDELFALQLGVLARRRAVTQTVKPHAYGDDGGLLDRFAGSLPFALTGAQRRVIGEVMRDLLRPQPMNRLIQGDVGSGKTVVAAAAMLRAVGGGLQAALMAPTEILAEQHYLTLRPLLAGVGVTAALLVGSQRKAGRAAATEAIASGEADVAIGTHALIEGGVAFRRLGLIVVDEQHKFGVLQRAELRRKGLTPDVLVMTATPIPRTLALTLYGDLDVSVLDALPPGRGPVSTFRRAPDRRPAVYEFVRAQVREGRQAFIVCPLVEESEKLQAKAATELAEHLAREVFPDLRVGLVHGRQSVEERDGAMTAFRRGETQVLVATTVIEVGIDVPNATVMVVEDAGRFGLAQLHQLRGRIGRGAHRSYCILIASPSNGGPGSRIDAMVRTGDGFEIAREDLELRGPGELLGTRQHGLPDLRAADLLNDLDLMERARDEAGRVLERDADLSRAEHAGLRRLLRRHFRSGLELLSVS